MSLLQKTDVYQGTEEKVVRKHPEYGFVLALICVALALVVASVMFPSVFVGGEIPLVGP
jgi:Glu-tRNA(Gln) amidotransferase subunit E-like FAD-binding protein